MESTGIITLLLLAANVILSAIALRNERFFEKLVFETDAILIHKEYCRLLSSGFVHLSWGHLIFNLVTLYAFSSTLEYGLGPLAYLCIYFSGLIGGSLLSLYFHRQHGDYRAAGASGAVCGMVFACIALLPGLELSVFTDSFSVPAWLYALVYILYTVFGIRSQRGNIGHEAHLGGALAGMCVAFIFAPQALKYNLSTVLIIAVPTLIFIYMSLSFPHLLLIGGTKAGSEQFYDIDDKYNHERREKELELDGLLDKINQKGIESLSSKERKRLDELSGKR